MPKHLDYIETLYNKRRFHSYLKCVSPKDCEKRTQDSLIATRSRSPSARRKGLRLFANRKNHRIKKSINNLVEAVLELR